MCNREKNNIYYNFKVINMNLQLIMKHFINLFIKIVKEINFLGWSGLLATFIGIISFLPIIYKIIITKKTDNFTISSLLLALTSNILWVVYGSGEKLFIPFLSGLLYFVIYSIILFYKLFI